jgi:uncharacterized integral membrane protein
MTDGRTPLPRWDLPLSIVLLVLLIVGALLFAGVILLSGMYSEACGSDGVVCNWTGFQTGLMVGSIGQGVVVLAALGGTAVLRVTHRQAFWAPLAGIVLALLVLLAGLGLIAWSIPGAVL